MGQQRQQQQEQKEYPALGYVKKNAAEVGDEIRLEINSKFLLKCLRKVQKKQQNKNEYKDNNEIDDTNDTDNNENEVDKLTFYGKIIDIPYPTRTMAQSASPEIRKEEGKNQQQPQETSITEKQQVAIKKKKINLKDSSPATASEEKDEEKEDKERNSKTMSPEEAKAAETARKATKLAEMKRKLEAFQAKQKKK